MPACTQCRAEVAPGVRVCPSCHALVPLDSSGALAPGVTIDRGDSRLVVDEKIGEGGMGVVFRAWRFFPPGDPRGAGGPRLLALKALRAHRAQSSRVREYFRREADALRVLSHPNIVQFDEMFEYADASILAMELVDGEALSAIVKRHRARAAPGSIAGPNIVPPLRYGVRGSMIPCMPALRALAYFEQLMGALAALHAMGIVHRDVKPQNVLVRRDGIVKLTDFGIAKHGFGEAGSKPVTEAGIAPGTGVYMSPEQVVGAPLDGRSDLYSAAIVLWEALAGHTPISAIGKSEIEVRQEQLGTPAPPIRSVFAQLPPPIDAFFERALAKDPNARFPDAIAMGAAARDAFGLAESDEWRALAEMAGHARAPVPSGTARLGTLRDIVVARYRTEPMPTKDR